MKLIKLDTKVDLTKIADNFLKKEPSPEEQKAFQSELEAWAKKPEAERGARPVFEQVRMSATEFFKDICGQAIRQVHKAANIASLRRTNKIMSEFDDAIQHPEKAGIVTLDKDDFDYLRKSFKTADNWQNTPEIARALIAVDTQFDNAEELDA